MENGKLNNNNKIYWLTVQWNNNRLWYFPRSVWIPHSMTILISFRAEKYRFRSNCSLVLGLSVCSANLCWNMKFQMNVICDLKSEWKSISTVTFKCYDSPDQIISFHLHFRFQKWNKIHCWVDDKFRFFFSMTIGCVTAEQAGEYFNKTFHYKSYTVFVKLFRSRHHLERKLRN